MIRSRYASSATFGASRAISDGERRLEARGSRSSSFGRTRRAARRSASRPRRAARPTPRRCRSRRRSRSGRRPSSARRRRRSRLRRTGCRASRSASRRSGRRRRPCCRCRAGPTSSETIVTSSIARKPREDRVLGSLVDRGRLVAAERPAPTTGSRSARVGSSREHALARPRPTRGRPRASRSQRQEAAGRSSASDRRTCSSAASRRRGARSPTRPRCASAAAGTRPPPHRGRRPPPPRRDAACTSRPRGASRSTTSGSRPSPSSSSYRPCRDRGRGRAGHRPDGRSAFRCTPSTDCAMRCVGKIVSPSCSVGTITTSIHADSSEPSSSWKASAVS